MIKNKINLRKFPYPYKAACTICSDIDRTDWDTFVYIHNLLNVELGLEIGDSFWMYSAKPDTDDAFTYFDGTSDKKSPYAEQLADLIRSGYIDCLHSYGNFSQKGGFKRELAKKALDELKSQGLKLEVWTGHGDTHNFQNIGNLGDLPFAVAADGTKTRVQEYHADLLIDYGVKFIWESELTRIVGHYRDYSLISYLLSEGTEFVKVAKQLLKFIKIKLSGKNPLNNRLLNPVFLRDGRKAYSFTRFGAWDKGTPSALPELLSKNNLEKLIRAQGYMIIYNHLGKETCDGKGLHEKNIIDALRNLKREYESGNVWVATTARLLRYNMVWHGLDWEVKKQGDKTIIDIKGINGPVFGEIIPGEEMLQGITFSVPCPEKTEICIRGKSMKSVKRTNGTIGIQFIKINNLEGVLL